MILCLFFSNLSSVFSQTNSQVKVRKIDGKYGIAIIGGSCYGFNFKSLHEIPYLLNEPSNTAFFFPSVTLHFGNREKNYLSMTFIIGQSLFPKYGTYQNHELIKSFSSMYIGEFKFNKVVINKKKIRQSLGVGLNFAKTTLTSMNVMYYTYPNDTIQYFFTGKLKQNWILSLSTSLFFISKKKTRDPGEISFGLIMGYNLGLLKGKIIQYDGLPLQGEPAVTYTGPYISLVLLQLWSKKKEKDGV